MKILRRKFSFLPQEVMIVAAKRTPMGSFMGGLKGTPATVLAAHSIQATLQQANIPHSAIQELTLGHLYSAGMGQAPTRQACLLSGLPESTICTSINKTMTSGIKSISIAASNIALGISETAIAGGMENMSLCPHLLTGFRTGKSLGDAVAVDSLAHDGLFCQFNQMKMGSCCERTLQKHGITREQQDAYCISSYKRAKSAYEAGFFRTEISPIEIRSKNKEILLNEDEEYSKVDFNRIPSLRPVFEQNGTITSANASPISDGACTLLLMSAAKAKELNVKPLARILSFADHALETMHFSEAPGYAIETALKRAGLELSQVDLFEVNEAFSGVVLINMKILDVPHEIMNVNGGAVSLGHPLGVSGARIVATLLYSLKNTNKRIGAAGICNGGGGASSMIIENLNE